MSSADKHRIGVSGPSEITDLATALGSVTRGDVLAPDDPSFPAAAFGFSTVDGEGPELVVIASDVQDVVAAARMAGASKRRLQPCAHLGSGAPTRPRTVPAGTILVVTRLLADVSIDPVARTATVGAGAGWNQLLRAAAQVGLGAAERGSATASMRWGTPCPVTSVADQLRSLQVVTSRGDIVELDPERDPGRFQACRDGITAFGVVTAATVRLHPQTRVLRNQGGYALPHVEPWWVSAS